MNNTIKPTLKLGAAAALVAFGLTGCMLGNEKDRYNSDGLSSFVKEESESMGQVLSDTAAPAALAKGAAAADTGIDTVTGEYVLIPLHYDAACQCFVRKATLTLSTGFTRQREDTLQLFLDSNSTMPDSTFRPRSAVSIVHKRHVIRTSASGRQVDLHFNTDMHWAVQGGQSVGVWNGSFRGSYENTQYGTLTRTATVTNLTRPFLGLGLHRIFGAPTSGSVHVEGLLFTFDLVIDGPTSPGTATVTVTRKSDQKTFVIKIDVNNKEI